MNSLMNLTVNGEARTFQGPPTLAALVESLGLDLRKVAVERNLEIVPRSQLPETPVADGDRIEIVVFVGGG
jgi:sulfur carrier protein